MLKSSSTPELQDHAPDLLASTRWAKQKRTGGGVSHHPDLEAAEAVLDDAMPGAAPAWFDYYDRPRLAGFKGQVHIRLAQPEMAHAVLEEAVGALDPEAAKQRACYLVDQAMVCVDEGEVDQACQLGIQALQLLGEVEYETGVQRVRDLRTKLRPWRDHPAVAALTEQLLLVS